MRHSPIQPRPEQHHRFWARDHARLAARHHRQSAIAIACPEPVAVPQLHHQLLLHDQHVLDIGIKGFAGKSESALNGGHDRLQVIAACQRVHDLMTQREAGKGSVTVHHRNAKTFTGTLHGDIQRLRPDPQLIQRQQRAGFIAGKVVPLHQLTGHPAAGIAKMPGLIAFADQHAEPGETKRRSTGHAVIQRHLQHPADQQQMQLRAVVGGDKNGAGHQVQHRLSFLIGVAWQSGKSRLRGIADPRPDRLPGGVNLRVVRITPEMHSKYRQPGERSFQRQMVVGLAHMNFSRETGCHRFFTERAWLTQQSGTELLRGREISMQKLALRLINAQHKVIACHHPLAELLRAAKIAQRREIISGTFRSLRST